MPSLLWSCRIGLGRPPFGPRRGAKCLHRFAAVSGAYPESSCTPVASFVWPEGPTITAPLDLILASSPPFGIYKAAISTSNIDYGDGSRFYEVLMNARSAHSGYIVPDSVGGLAILPDGADRTMRSLTSYAFSSEGTKGGYEIEGQCLLRFYSGDPLPVPGETVHLVVTPLVPPVPYSYVVPREAVSVVEP